MNKSKKRKQEKILFPLIPLKLDKAIAIINKQPKKKAS